jgi:hypothetical protein
VSSFRGASTEKFKSSQNAGSSLLRAASLRMSSLRGLISSDDFAASLTGQKLLLLDE